MRDSADILTDPPPPAADARIAYGPEPLQFGDLRVPAGEGPFPLALVLHGGYWQAIYNLIHTGHLCEALAEAGIASWNLEYRCVGDPGGEWPAAAEDLELALAHLDRLPFAHDGRTVLVGHSAGGQLALWAAKRGEPAGGRAGPGLRRARRRRPPRPRERARPLHGAGALRRRLAARAAPARRAADRDPRHRRRLVPYEMSERYVAAAAGTPSSSRSTGLGHFEPIDPLSAEWPAVKAAIERLLEAPGSDAPPR